MPPSTFENLAVGDSFFAFTTGHTLWRKVSDDSAEEVLLHDRPRKSDTFGPFVRIIPVKFDAEGLRIGRYRLLREPRPPSAVESHAVLWEEVQKHWV